jgi:TniQ/Tn7-like transposition protein D
LIGSVLSRSVIYTGLPPTRLLEIIAGRDRSNYSFFLPSGMSRLAVLMGLDAKELLWKHTPFPYMTAFMSIAEVERQEAKLLSNAEGVVSMSALIQSVSQGLPALRFCTRCVDDNRLKFGESYWHREHSLPAMHICSRHGIPLRLSTLDRRRWSRGYGEGLPQHQQGATELENPSGEIQETMATFNIELLQSKLDKTANLLANYRTQALALGYTTAGGEVASAQMAADFSSFFGGDYLAAVGCTVKPARPWPALLVREGTNVPFIPAKHVLLQTFFRHCAPGPKKLAYFPPGKRPRSVDTLDDLLANKVSMAITRANRRNVRTTMTKLLQSAGGWSAFRHDRADFPKTGAVLADFRCTEASERKTGGRAVHRKRMLKRAQLQR